MDVKSAMEERVLTLRLVGELDHHAAKDVMQRMELALERSVPRQLVLELSGVSFMDSSGLAVVLRAQRRMQTLGGSAVVKNAPAQVRRVLEAANMGRWIRLEQEEGK